MHVGGDFVQGAFEMVATFFVLLNVRRVLRDRAVRGVSPVAVGFFCTWGLWNLVYYPSLSQWWAFAGGIGVVSANLWYVALLVRFSWRKTCSR